MDEMEGEQFDFGVKLLMIGDSGVGKSCLLSRYTGGVFHDTFIATIGIDFKIKYLDVLGSRVKLQIWDTAGQERFRTITNAYYRGAMGVVLVYDCTDTETFENVRTWMAAITQHSPENVKVVLVGNKCDVTDSKAVSTQEGQDLANEFGCGGFFEASAKEDINVEELFTYLTAAIVDEFQKAEPGGKTSEDNGAVKVGAAAGGKKKDGCC